MTPVCFDGCFGWLHPGRAARGVVLCGAQAGEEMTTHRAWLKLAAQLSAQGVPTLRFDYRGAGNSADDDRMPGRLQAWCDSILAAVAFLGRQTGVTEIALVGLRLGASLAALAAARVTGNAGPAITAVALMAPVVSGALYLRELQILSKLGEASESRSPRTRIAPARCAEDDGDGRPITWLGFDYAADTAGDLARLDLLATAVAPAPRLLIYRHPSRASDRQLAAHFRALGASVEEEEFVEFPRLMRGPIEGAYPQAAFDRVAAWLREALPSRVNPSAAAPPAAVHRLPGSTERPVLFGEGNRLFGMICEPEAVRPARPAVIFLNTWWHHHIGIGRFAVTSARSLAAAGYPSFRFDASGIGDSTPGDDREPAIERGVGDVRAALDHLGQLGHHSFLLIGLCWGADLAARASVRDARVAGQIFINSQDVRDELVLGEESCLSSVPVRTLVIFGDEDCEGLEARLAGATREGAVRTHVIRDADHSFRRREARQALISLIEDNLSWVASDRVYSSEGA